MDEIKDIENALNARDEALARLRLRHEAGETLSEQERLYLRQANAQALAALPR